MIKIKSNKTCDRSVLKLFVIIIGVFTFIVLPAIVLNYYEIGKPYTGYFLLFFVNDPIRLFLDMGLSGVTETGKCSPIFHCKVTASGWFFLGVVWIGIAVLLAWIISATTNAIKKIG